MIAWRNMIWSLSDAMAKTTTPWTDGHILPGAEAGAAYQVLAPEAYVQVKNLIEKTVASGLIYMNSHAADVAAPEFPGLAGCSPASCCISSWISEVSYGAGLYRSPGNGDWRARWGANGRAFLASRLALSRRTRSALRSRRPFVNSRGGLSPFSATSEHAASSAIWRASIPA